MVREKAKMVVQEKEKEKTAEKAKARAKAKQIAKASLHHKDVENLYQA